MLGKAIAIAFLFLQLTVGGGEVANAAVAGMEIAPEAIPYRDDSEPAAGGLARVAGALVLSLLILFAILYALRRFGLTSRYDVSGGRISLRSTRRLTPQITAFVIAVDDREYLLMQTRDGLHVIEHHGRPEAVEPE